MVFMVLKGICTIPLLPVVLESHNIATLLLTLVIKHGGCDDFSSDPKVAS